MLVLVPALLLAVSSVSGHSELVKSEPASGQSLKQSPEKVVAWFSEELDTSSSEMKVLDAQGRQVDNGDGGVDLDDLDHLTMIVTLPPELPDSTYTVHWVSASVEDGDVVEGDFTFGVGVAASQPSSQPKASPAPPILWLLTGLFAVILAAAGVIAIRWRRNGRLEERVTARDRYA